MVGRQDSEDASLGDWLEDTLSVLDDDPCPPPEFGEMMRRAHEMNDEAVDASMLDRALARAPDAANIPPPGDEGRTPKELEVFVSDAQRAADKAVTERRQTKPSRPLSFATGLSRWTALAAAALALVGLGFVLARSNSSTTERRPELRETLLSADLVDTAVTTSSASARPPRTSTPRTHSPAPLEPAPEASLEPAPEAQVAPPSSPPPPTPRSPRRRPSPPETSTPPPNPLHVLDKAAQAAWRDGDLKQATALFEQVVADGRGTKWAHLAYGDLFALARQSGRPQLEESRWKEYLAAYPRGPHADDAQAGLCRRSIESERRACWQSYLETYPKGAHRRRGIRVLEATPDARP
ncbi:MAG: hypothetical protein ACRBN8_12130 [Nannocystales bacterium]